MSRLTLLVREQSGFAARFYSGLPGSAWKHRLLSLPLYLVEQWKHIPAQLLESPFLDKNVFMTIILVD